MSFRDKQQYYFVITDDIAKSDLTPSEKLVASSILKRTRDNNRTGFVMLRAGWIMEDWNISAEIVTNALKSLSQHGYIVTKRTCNGYNIRWAKVDETDDKEIPDNSESVSVKHGMRIRESRNAIPENTDCSLTKGLNKDLNKEQQQEDGLSLSDGASNLPNPNTYKPENLAPRKGAVLTEAQRNLATQLLGASGQDRQFAASVSQEMANKTGFLEFYLKATIKASKERKIKGTTIAYLIGSINNSWCNGDWVDPDQAAREQKEKEIAARRARLDRLT